MINLICLTLVAAAAAKPMTEKFEFDSTQIKSVLIHNSSGNLDVAPTLGRKSFVVINKSKWGPRCKLNVDFKDGHLQVETDDSSWILDQECRADIIVSVPELAALQVRAGTGDVKILAKRGDVDVKVGSGLITVKGDLNKLTAISGSGDVKIDGQPKSVDVRTGSGDIALNMKDITKSTLQLKTGSGDVDITLPASAKVLTSTATGNGTVTNDFESQENADLLLNASSESGDIQIRKQR